ncbi:MAG: hypothetical protein H6729_11180 [Deltaproteobacteria bacterium]|nr:hypothetical protein [Deltaproteobacteria bacterium]
MRSEPPGLDCGATCETRVVRGEDLVLVAAADDQSILASWSVPGCGQSDRCQVPTTADGQVSVTFTRKKHRVLVALAGDGHGEITSSVPGIRCGSECTAKYEAGTLIELTAAPSTGSAFGGWSGDCTGLDPICELRIDEDRLVSAAFDQDKVSLSIALSGDGHGVVRSTDGVISCPGRCAGSFTRGASIDLEAEADPNSFFGGWLGEARTQPAPRPADVTSR